MNRQNAQRRRRARKASVPEQKQGFFAKCAACWVTHQMYDEMQDEDPESEDGEPNPSESESPSKSLKKEAYEKTPVRDRTDTEDSSEGLLSPGGEDDGKPAELQDVPLTDGPLTRGAVTTR